MLEDDAPQIHTTFERTVKITITTYFLHLSWDHDLLQAAFVEAALRYFLDVLWERNVCQTAAVTERPISDLFQLQTCRESHFLQILTSVEGLFLIVCTLAGI